MEVGDLDDDLDEVLAVEAEDVLGDGLEPDLALGAGVSAHWQEQEAPLSVFTFSQYLKS